MVPDSSLNEEIRRFEEQYRSQPESLVFARLADACRRAGQLERALQIVGAGLARHPEYVSGHIVRARTLQSLGRPDEALLAFRRVQELDAQNLVAVRELARSADQRGDLEEARHWYERLVQVDPTSDEATRRLADLEAGDDAPVRDENGSAIAPWERADDTESESGSVEGPAQTPDEDGEAADAARRVTEPDIPASGEEAVEAILNGDVPHSLRAEDTWWYEDEPRHAADEPSRDADLLTRTMADLYAEQGLYREAADIYEELLRDSPDDAGLAERLADLRSRARARSTGRSPQAAVGEAARPAETAETESTAPPESVAGDAEPPEAIGRSTGIPVADELRRLLRLGEERAASLADPEPRPSEAVADEAAFEAPPEDVRPDDEPKDPARAHERSGFVSEWLRSLEQGP